MAQIKPKDKPHYVNNREFSEAVMDYAVKAHACRKADKPVPIVPDYIAKCFIRISEGLSHRPNFVRYTYREEMVIDAVENCLKAITNYNIDTATRTGTPNAFSYFTQICYFAFIRRLAIFFFFKQKTAYEISECDWIQTCALPIRRFFFFKQKTAYEISECDWSSDVCSSD